jgi:hypothetical protein
MNLVSLLILPAVITYHYHPYVRYPIAGGALVILLGAIAFSKRKAPSFTEEPALVDSGAAT